MTERPFTMVWLRSEGFSGFRSISDIRQRWDVITPRPGVYVVYRESLDSPTFLDMSTGGWFKGRNPSVTPDRLLASWVDEAHVLYIGKAGAGGSGTRGIRKRLDEYLRFGMGEPIGHWGGRYLWQLDGTDVLKICFKVCSEPRAEEKRLLVLFREEYRSLPFANLRG